ncbi:hypothetical protein MRX96_054967 [Rhipicephalus microplus]
MRAAVDVAVLARAPSAAVDAARDGTAEAREQRDPARQASHGRVPPSGEERDRGSCAPQWKRVPPPRSNTRRGRRADWDRGARTRGRGRLLSPTPAGASPSRRPSPSPASATSLPASGLCAALVNLCSLSPLLFHWLPTSSGK